jgi:pimeloyl-ACP methyl ester carboxylesterase
VITVDLPGFGGSPLLDYSFSLEDIAKEIKSFLDSIKLEKYVLIGHSLGGYTALAFAKIFEDNLLGLGLFHSSVFEDDREKKENRTKLMEFIKTNGVKTFIKTFIPSLFYKENIGALKDIIQNLKKSAEQTPPESVIQYARAMRDRNSSEDMLKEFSKPVMFIIGDEDTSVPLKKSLQQVIMPGNAHFLKLAKTGHMGMFEKPDETTHFIEGFLNFCK